MPSRSGSITIGLAALSLATTAHAQSHLMRYADVHGDRIVFTYEDDLWLVDSEGGDAWRVTNHPGRERYAKFSPDGKRLAFTAEYDGGTDVYVMDARGGVPERLTYHPAADDVLAWTGPTTVLFRSRREYPTRVEMLYQVDVAGGPPLKLPVDQGGLASVSADGTRIAYNRITREARTWKRHQGGTAQDVWVGTLAERSYRRITDWPGSDNFPMWDGERIVFTSDREHGTSNLYRCDADGGNVTALTSYDDYDVKYPSMGTGQIVFQYGESLHLYDLASGDVRFVPVRVPSDLVHVRPTLEDAAVNTGSFGLSPDGERLLLESRGEILSLPVDEDDDHEPVDLTRALASREKDAVWSPDGAHVAFFSDRTGEEELYLVAASGRGEWRRLTSDGSGFRMRPVWSPDGHGLLFTDKAMRLNHVDVESGSLSVLDQGEYDDAWERWGIQDYVWSPDGRWVAYTKMEANLYESIFLHSLDTGTSHRVTSEMTYDFSPSFDPEGRYLYFLSNRTFEPVMGVFDQNHVFLDACRPYLVCLSADAFSPFAPADSAEPAADGAQASEAGERPPTRIDLGGFARRVVAIPGVPAGNAFRLEATPKGFLYLAKDEPEFLKYQTVTDRTPGRLDLYHYDLAEREPEKLLAGIANYHLSANGEKLVYRAGRRYGVVDAGATAAVGDGEVDLEGVKVPVDRAQEFLQIFDEAWRVQRDWFYDAGMHDVDWDAVRDKYRRFVPHCGNRGDLTYLIGEAIGELNAGHTYVFGGDGGPGGARVSTGLLGVDFEAPPRAAYPRIARIVRGDNADESARSPLYEPGCPVKAGDYLIAIDGEACAAGENPLARLVDKAEKVVTLTYNDRPTPEGAREHRVRTLRSEDTIRYREWVEDNRAYVAAITSGQVGYLHLPDMMDPGLIEFARAFYPQTDKHALVIDERYNGGGFVGDMLIDRLERRIWGFVQPREGRPSRLPERVFHGHLAVLVNEHTGSNGEYFARAVQLKGLAPILGMRTWGGAVGIEPHQDLVDGGVTTPPQFAPYGLDGSWLIEGVGVVPDIEVQNEPADVLRGMDPQLDRAVELLLERLQDEPCATIPPPVYPDKDKPGR